MVGRPPSGPGSVNLDVKGWATTSSDVAAPRRKICALHQSMVASFFLRSGPLKGGTKICAQDVGGRGRFKRELLRSHSPSAARIMIRKLRGSQIGSLLLLVVSHVLYSFQIHTNVADWITFICGRMFNILDLTLIQMLR